MSRSTSTTRLVAALDQGTTSTRCMLFNQAAEVVSVHQLEHRQIYPRPGWVEHDPGEIWERTVAVIRGALEKASVGAESIAAVGVTNQRETTVVWERKTGRRPIPTTRSARSSLIPVALAARESTSSWLWDRSCIRMSCAPASISSDSICTRWI